MQGCIVARDSVAFVFFGPLHNDLRHLRNFAHESLTAQLTLFDLFQASLPIAGQFRRGQFANAKSGKQGHELACLGAGHHFPALTPQIAFIEQTLNNGRPGGRRAQAALRHGIAQLFVINQLARPFHGREQRGFRESGGWLGNQAFGLDIFGFNGFTLCHRNQGGVIALNLTAVNGQPAGCNQHFAFGFEMVPLYLGNTRSYPELRRREEHGQEAARYQFIYFAFCVAEFLGNLQRRNNGKVV